MTIIYLHQYFKFPHENGGTRSYDLATAFVQRGYKVIVVTATNDERYKSVNRWTKETVDGLEIHRTFLPYSNHLSYIKRMAIFFKFLSFASYHILKIKADFVLATSTPLTIAIPALIKKLIAGTPFIFEVRDVWPEAVIAVGAIRSKIMQRMLYALEEHIYNNAHAIVPLSTDMQKSILSRHPRFKEKTNIVIENIAEITRFHNNKNSVDLRKMVGFTPRFSVLYAGTFGKVNGVHKFIDLAEKTLLMDPTIIFILLGAGAEKERVVQIAQDKSVLNKNVFILEPITKSQLPLWYNAVSMGASFVIDVPELWANSANKFFDTLAASKPVLINHEGWQAHKIRSSDVGYVLPFEISERAAEAFVSYTTEVDKIRQQEQNALQLAKAEYSLQIAVDKYISLFNRLRPVITSSDSPGL